MSTEQFDSAPPTVVAAVVLDATTGKELARGAYPITYRRTDGGGRCPGPTAPEPVIITIPTQRS
ncbi:hypothetical protein [Pengzhenrongella phosphoraccumulans]|uniref:hypothetical protein n=1 Tax=Pengzhenrongella phosphoraccumulans TaxID=3114394 RepID=UPI00388E213C